MGTNEKLIKLFENVIDPYREGLGLWETNDGFIGNGHWVVKKELLDRLGVDYQRLVEGRLDRSVYDELQKAMEKDEKFDVDVRVSVYEEFNYYAERTEVWWNGRKYKFYVLDVPKLFKKVSILKVYADFIEGVVSLGFGGKKRKLYYIEVDKRDNKKEVSAYFVWTEYELINGADRIVAVCCGALEED